MTEGIFALVGVVIGAVLGIAGTALTERWRHSYIRNDARADRQAATLREALSAYAAFIHAWAPVLNQMAKGAKVDILAPEFVAGPPGETQRGLVAVTQRIHIESLRHRLSQVIDMVAEAAVRGGRDVNVAWMGALDELGTKVAADIGTELRKLEAE